MNFQKKEKRPAVYQESSTECEMKSKREKRFMLTVFTFIAAIAVKTPHRINTMDSIELGTSGIIDRFHMKNVNQFMI